MSAYTYTYKGEDFRVQVSRCQISPKYVAVFFTKLNLTTFEVKDLGWAMTTTQRQAFFATPTGGGLGVELLEAIIDWAAQNVKDKIVLDDRPEPEDYISPTWTKV